jgi:O-antigen/teichoic acid export membrane protein
MTTGGSWRRGSPVSHVLPHRDTSIGSAKPADGVSVAAEPVAIKIPLASIKMMGRFGWGLADQLLSSATNFLLALLVARTVGSRDLGAFSVAYATFTFSLGAVRAIAGELLVVRHSAVSADEWRDGVTRSAGTALIAGVIVGVGCLVTAAGAGEPFRTVLGIVGLALPFLLVQDVWRFAFFARGRGSAAFLNDVVWVVTMFAAFGLVRYYHVSSVAWLTLGWASAGALAAIVGVFQLKVLPSGPVAAVKWLRHHREIAPRFFAEFAVSSGVSNLTLFAIGAIAGLGELGRLRAGEIALGPLTVLFAGAGMVATAEGVRLLHESPRRLVRGCRGLSLALAAGVVAWGVVILAIPRTIGESLLRANWDAARPLLLPLVIALIGYALSFGAWTGLRSLAAAKRSLRARCIDGSLTFSLGLTGAYLGGATGVAWGYAVTGILRSLNAWWQFSRALGERETHEGYEVGAHVDRS